MGIKPADPGKRGGAGGIRLSRNISRENHNDTSAATKLDIGIRRAGRVHLLLIFPC